jgi:hypothetical protein
VDSETTHPCPSCDAPRASEDAFCKRCGFEPAVHASEESYLDDVELPQGYAKEDPYATAPKPRATRREWIVVFGLTAVLVGLLPLLAWLFNRAR